MSAVADGWTPADEAEWSSRTRDSGRPGLAHTPCVTAAEFVAIERPPTTPYIATPDQRSVLFARNTSLLVGGPSGVAKSLALIDVCGKLADDHPSKWLGLRVRGGLRVLLVVYDGEGSDEDVQERINLLVRPSAQTRLFVWDRWRLGPVPRASAEGIRALASEIKRLSVDVVALDTAPAFFSGIYDTKTGIPEEAHCEIEQVRELAEQPLAFAMNVHTRKKDTRTTAKALDELEEIAGHPPRWRRPRPAPPRHVREGAPRAGHRNHHRDAAHRARSTPTSEHRRGCRRRAKEGRDRGPGNRRVDPRARPSCLRHHAT
jgi:hypothetical protein